MSISTVETSLDAVPVPYKEDSMIQLSYYVCNSDSVWAMAIILFLSIFFIVVIKIIIFGQIYENNNNCYPPAYFFGNTTSARHPFYSLTHDGFQNRRNMVSLGKEKIRYLNYGIIEQSDIVYNTLIKFVQDQTKFDLRYFMASDKKI